MARRQGKPNRKTLPGRLRIVAGNWRSRLLEIAELPGLRPTSERVRETLFNWLMPRIEGARCLDLFAGTGALGFEALSRGAASAVFVETAAKAVAVLRRNRDLLGADNATICKSEAAAFLAAGQTEQFDVVFVDPPFAADQLEAICQQLAQSGLLAVPALVYLEDDCSRAEPSLPAGWEVIRQRKAGNVRYALVAVNAENGELLQ